MYSLLYYCPIMISLQCATKTHFFKVVPLLNVFPRRYNPRVVNMRRDVDDNTPEDTAEQPKCLIRVVRRHARAARQGSEIELSYIQNLTKSLRSDGREHSKDCEIIFQQKSRNLEMLLTNLNWCLVRHIVRLLNGRRRTTIRDTISNGTQRSFGVMSD
ncbi:hypothetical protein DFH28DRAFT_459559 [Melampsora americana]|nr:hypothetical protein DFH28DRAFT_459559 [Melampsora americana]